MQNLINQARSLASKQVDISSHGVYPESKKRTKVQDVAVYQNDGTATIAPARFVERAEARAGDWVFEIRNAIIDYIDSEGAALDLLGRVVSRNINDMCDRIKTRRLKHSFRHVIKNK